MQQYIHTEKWSHPTGHRHKYITRINLTLKINQSDQIISLSILVLSDTNDNARIEVFTVLSISLLSITLAIFNEPRLQLISCPQSLT